MLELRRISKSFPGVQALDDVSFTLRPGQINALLGENGAGKSTLINIVCGIHQPDAGEMFLQGERFVPRSFQDALARGIGLVSQELHVLPDSSIAENILLDRMKSFRRLGTLRWREINATAQKYMEMVGLTLPPTTVVEGLSAATKQLIQIAKALALHAKVLLLDEPTSSLTLSEAKNLFTLLRQLRDRGVIMLFVSHKLEEAFALCDEVTVLRDGKLVGSRPSAGLPRGDLVKMMIGREARDEFLGRLAPDGSGPALEVRELQKEGAICGANFSLRRGEILGFYGLVGSGRTELAKAIIGEAPADSGQVLVKGLPVRIGSPADSLHRHGIGYVSENRKEEGLILDASVKTNIAITIWRRLLSKIFRTISLKQETAEAQGMVDALAIKITGLEQLTSTLSGGNQQKVSIAKWLAAGCDILIIDEPTVGVDIGAKEYIHGLIWDLAKTRGKAIILISSDMPEMIKLARRILVFKEKRIVGEIDLLDREAISYDEVSQRIGQLLA